MAESSTTDTKQKKELESRQQQQDNSTPVTATTTTANDYYGSRNNQVEAIAVQGPVGPDGHSVAQHAPGLVVVHEQVAVNQLARDYRHCCYTIAIEDPVEMVHARNIAIAHIVFEVLALFIMLCFSGWCITITVLAVVSSSTVACCFRQREFYSAWSLMGLLLVILHFVAGRDAMDKSDYETGYVIFGLIHFFLCLVSMVVVCVGCKAASATGGRALLERRQADGQPVEPMQGPVHVGQEMLLSQVDSHAA